MVGFVALSRRRNCAGMRAVCSAAINGSPGCSALRVPRPQPSFSGFYAPSSYLVVLLEVFTVALFACAVAAEYIGTIFERLQAHSLMARDGSGARPGALGHPDRAPASARSVDRSRHPAGRRRQQLRGGISQGRRVAAGRTQAIRCAEFLLSRPVQALIAGSEQHGADHRRSASRTSCGSRRCACCRWRTSGAAWRS